MYNLISFILFRTTFLLGQMQTTVPVRAPNAVGRSPCSRSPVVLFIDPNWGGMKSQNAEMQVTLKLASYFHTNVRDLSQYTWFSFYAQWTFTWRTHIANRERERGEHSVRFTQNANDHGRKTDCWPLLKTNCICNLFTIILPFHIYWN